VLSRVDGSSDDEDEEEDESASLALETTGQSSAASVTGVNAVRGDAADR